MEIVVNTRANNNNVNKVGCSFQRKSALPYDEAMDLVRGVVRNSTQTSVTKNMHPIFPSTLAVLTRGGNKDFAAAGSVTANQDRVLLLELSPNHPVYEKKMTLSWHFWMDMDLVDT